MGKHMFPFWARHSYCWMLYGEWKKFCVFFLVRPVNSKGGFHQSFIPCWSFQILWRQEGGNKTCRVWFLGGERGPWGVAVVLHSNNAGAKWGRWHFTLLPTLIGCMTLNSGLHLLTYIFRHLNKNLLHHPFVTPQVTNKPENLCSDDKAAIWVAHVAVISALLHVQCNAIRHLLDLLLGLRVVCLSLSICPLSHEVPALV